MIVRLSETEAILIRLALKHCLVTDVWKGMEERPIVIDLHNLLCHHTRGELNLIPH